MENNYLLSIEQNPIYDQYPQMKIIGSSFAEKFNKIQGDYWAKTGRTIDVESCLLEILIEDYDKRNN